MLLRVALFEIRYQLRQPLLWAVSAMFFVMSFIATITDALAIGGAIGSLNRNAPYVVVRMLADLSFVGAFVAVAFIATSILRDFERRTDELVFSRPVRTRDLLLGRFAGASAAACACFGLAAVGLFAGSLMPFLDPERIGPRSPAPYLYGLAVLAWPTIVALGAVLFALASRVRHIAVVYVALVGVLVAYFVASAMFGDLDSRPAAALLDPFGLSALQLQTRYWTVAEKNSLLPAIGGGMLLWNRLLWIALGAGLLGWAVQTFRYERAIGSRARRVNAVVAAPDPEPLRWRRVRPRWSAATPWRQLWSALRFESRFVLRGLPFLLLIAFGVINILSNIGYLDLMMGTPVWPVTHLMLLAIRAGYAFLLYLIIGFYAGELVWRERGARLEGVVDATPVPTWVPVVAKLGALWAAAVVFLGAGMAALVGYQLSLGYTHVQPALYLQGLVVEGLPFLEVAGLALAFQVVANQKFVGYLLMVLYLVSGAVAGSLHFDRFLYRFAETPSAPYSDMNGWGHFVAPLVWFNLYWLLGSGALLCLAYAGWVRGDHGGRRGRVAAARARLRGPALALLAMFLAGFAVTGGFVYYNTSVVNRFLSYDEAEQRQVDYERNYRRYRELPQPRIVAVTTNIDLFPRERRAEIRGTYRLANHTAAPITALHIGVSPRLAIRSFSLPPHKVVLEDRRLGYGIYELATPLAPGQEVDFGFDLEIANHGFVNSDPDNTVVENGTFFYTRQLPLLGYQDYREMGDPARRRAHGLPPVSRMARIDDQEARFSNTLARDADWLDFDATISTEPDQIALAPGYLQREWTQGGRRYFHYKAESPIPKFFAFLSARYAVTRDTWHDVEISVFHHPDHSYNVNRMIDAVKKTLQYMTENFTPYQDRQVRIAEFPRYARIAGSFPTIIPFSESIGFIARPAGGDGIDYPFYVTAHEVAHQWWGYQVLGADVQGSGLLSETMAQYSALMVMRREYGAERMRKFLRYELDRYLSGRGGELVEEVPLALVEDQPYIHYSKGSLALYAIQDALGEARLNEALRGYIQAVRFQQPPYTISRDLIAAIRAATPADRQRLLDDLFSAIVLFDNEATSAVARARPDGRFDVTITARARKLQADGKGVEHEVALDDWIDVGVFGEPVAGRDSAPVLFLQKQHVTGPAVTVTATVNARPARAGIDPYNILVDRTPGDNVRAVSMIP